MKYHCGLLDERPGNSRTLNWIMRPNWGHRPPEIEHELRVWLAMPGFTLAYHAHTLRHPTAVLRRYVGNFDEMRDEVIENWMSASRGDCIRLGQMRPERGLVPLITQVRAVEDLKTMSYSAVARDYGLNKATIVKWKRHGFAFSGPLPAWFSLLTASNSLAL